jgi:glycerol kinase
MNVILALDAGTTNVKAIIVDREANILARSSVPLTIQLQFQADVLDRQVMRSQTAELSGLGAAFAAGLGSGFWSSTEEVAGVVAPHDLFRPRLEDRGRMRLVHGWTNAVASVKMLSAALSLPRTSLSDSKILQTNAK